MPRDLWWDDSSYAAYQADPGESPEDYEAELAAEHPECGVTWPNSYTDTPRTETWNKLNWWDVSPEDIPF